MSEVEGHGEKCRGIERNRGPAGKGAERTHSDCALTLPQFTMVPDCSKHQTRYQTQQLAVPSSHVNRHHFSLGQVSFFCNGQDSWVGSSPKDGFGDKRQPYGGSYKASPAVPSHSCSRGICLAHHTFMPDVEVLCHNIFCLKKTMARRFFTTFLIYGSQQHIYSPS